MPRHTRAVKPLKKYQKRYVKEVEFEAILEILSCLHYVIQLTTLILVWTVLSDFGEASCPCCWLSWPPTVVTQSGGRKLDYIMMVAMRHLLVE